MTLNSDLIAISSVAVGGGTAYPVIRSRITTRFEGPEGQDTAAYRVEVWELVCHAFAATAGGVAALSETIRDDLCLRGEAVVLTEWAGTRTLPAAGGGTGSMAGYPTAELADEPERCFGNVLTFTLRCEARIPQPDGSSLVEHAWERTEETDEDGRLTITQRGTYRTRNTVDARTQAQSDIIDGEEADAAANDRTFRIRWTLGPDTAVAGYEFTAADSDGADAGVTEAQLVDRTVVSNEGRNVRTISGYAAGAGAAAWVAGQAPTPDATNILVRREESEPTVPDGRINFLWELITGVTDPQFPNVVIFGFRESIEAREEVAILTAATYLNHDPILRYAELRPTVYTQRTRMDFLGAWADAEAAITGLFDNERLVTTPVRRLDAGPYGLKTFDMTAVYMYETAILLRPEPREVPAIA